MTSEAYQFMKLHNCLIHPNPKDESKEAINVYEQKNSRRLEIKTQ